MKSNHLLLSYVILTLGAITWIAWQSSLRRKRFEPTPSRDHIFRCVNCGFVYTDDADVDRSRCPQCSQMNNKIDF